MSRDFILVFSGGVVSLMTTLVVLFVMDYFYRRDQRAGVDQKSQPVAVEPAPAPKVVAPTPEPVVVEPAPAPKVIEQPPHHLTPPETIKKKKKDTRSENPDAKEHDG
jgi:hypothetical protein